MSMFEQCYKVGVTLNYGKWVLLAPLNDLLSEKEKRSKVANLFPKTSQIIMTNSHWVNEENHNTTDKR